MLTITIEQDKQSTTVRCSGRIVMGMESDALRWTVLAQTGPKIILDFSGVTAIDAKGVGALVQLHSWAVQSGRTLTVLNPVYQVKRLIHLLGLAAVLNLEGPELKSRVKSDFEWDEASFLAALSDWDQDRSTGEPASCVLDANIEAVE